MSSDRAAVAREVLTELLRDAESGDGLVTPGDVERFMDEHYPAPPAPETVTVGAVNTLRTGTANTLAVTVGDRAWTLEVDGRWRWGSLVVERSNWAHDMLDRIASDARVIEDMSQRYTDVCEKWSDENQRRVHLTERIAEREARIAELEKASADYLRELNAFNTRVTELQSERDAALRALEAKDALDTGSTAETMAGISTGSKPWASEPLSAATPIPLGAVLEVEGDPDSPYERVSGGWIRECTPRATRVQRLEKVYRDDDAAWGNMLTRYYHARHPVATRETALQMCNVLWPHDKLDWHVSYGFERLRKAGFTLEGA